MRKLIKGKHIGKSFSVDRRTGKETPLENSMMMLPAKEGTCEECATAHDPILPHNAQSLFYQVYFHNEHGRDPTWIDAMAHSPDVVKSAWMAELERLGIDVKGGKINPEKK